jgi:large subunit ribosomal protein L2
MKMQKPIKYLTFGLKNKAGKNFTGKRVMLSKGSGRCKRKYRLIDFYRFNYKVQFVILRIEYDPNRSANIALICYKNGFLSYILLTEGLRKGDVINHNKATVGWTDQLKNIRSGVLVSCVEIYPNYGGKFARAAGCFCIIIKKFTKKVLIRLPSGEERLISANSKATIGLISNISHKLRKKRKAGDTHKLGIKPKVRGVAKNCVDHPNGGGRGKTSKWSECPNFTRRVLKGVKTSKSLNKNIIKSR